MYTESGSVGLDAFVRQVGLLKRGCGLVVKMQEFRLRCGWFHLWCGWQDSAFPSKVVCSVSII